MDEVCKMFGEEHPVSRERSLNHCVIVWWLDCLWLFREIMRTTVNFRQQKQTMTLGWQWMTMDRHSKTVQLCAPPQHPFSQTTHSTTPTATEASASKDDPESINAGAPNLSDRWLTPEHLHNGPALFEWKWLLWRVVSTCKQSKRRLGRGGLSWITFVPVDPRSPKTLHHMQNYIFRMFDIFWMGRMTRSN